MIFEVIECGFEKRKVCASIQGVFLCQCQLSTKKKMASEKTRRKIKDWRISSVKNDSSTQSDTTATSFDDHNERLDAKKAGGTPKFLRTQSSSGILASPRKSRSVARIFSSLKFPTNTSTSGSSDSSFGLSKSSSSRSDDNKNCNYSSLSNLTRLMSPSNRTAHVSLNQSKSMRSVDQIIDENTEFRMSCTNLDASNHSVMSASMSNSLEFNMNTSVQLTTTANRLLRYRMQHFRRRSISWDSSQTAKALMRYEFLLFVVVVVNPIA